MSLSSSISGSGWAVLGSSGGAGLVLMATSNV